MLASLADVVCQLQAVSKRPYLIGVDGRSGAGKSFLCERLREKLSDAVVVHGDDFYQVMDETVRATLTAEEGYYRYSDWGRLEQQALLPLTAGQPARYQRYDWVTGRLAEIIEVSPQRIVIVEGVCSTRPELRDYYDLRIWVETSESERARRQIARGENSASWIRRWAAAEIFYVDNFHPSQSAHLIVAGE